MENRKSKMKKGDKEYLFSVFVFFVLFFLFSIFHPLSSFFLNRQRNAFDQDNDRADGDGGIRDIKDRPDAQVDKINDVAGKDPVEQIADGAAQDQ